MQMLVYIGLVCTLVVLVLNIFLKKSKDLLDVKTQTQTYLEYKQTVQ